MEVLVFTLVLIISSAAFAYGWDEFELEGLLGFKKGLTNSSSLSNWMPENSHQLCTSWEGITCNNVTGHVEEILLSGLEGVFNPEISKLRFLTKLELVLSFLEGVVPPEIGLLTSLKTLNLTRNRFTGQVPPELCRLTALEILDLSTNRFVGQIPEKLGMLKSLTQIDLSWNQKLNATIPPSLGDLVNLELLDLSNNGFVGQIPKQLGMLKSLRHIDLHWNMLNGSIPPSLGDLVNLQFLDLSWNGLVGQIPKELGMLKSLRHIDLSGSGNRLNASVPPCLGDLVNLEFLALPSLPLTGAEFGKLRNLKFLYLTGEVIPPSIVNCSSLEDFSFSFDGGNESPIGNFPASFDKLNNLAHLSVDNYNVQIPEEIGNFSKLETIDIWGIRRSIPRSIFHLPRLSFVSFMDLVDDSSYWPFPEVWNMTSLEALRLHNVSLTGRLPDLLGSNSTALSFLDLSNNYLLGEVPAHVWQIESLLLNSNAFTGTIPTLDFSHTRILSASNNNLSGELSVYNSSDSLWLLDLSDNMLTGEIPNDIGRRCKKLEYFNFKGNRLQGNIPSGLANCTQLIYIELGKNQIQGKLDIDFTNFTSLEIFSIPDNNLEGEFPVLGSDSSIFIIDIKGNRFSGQIPAFVAQMKDLRFLIMRENLFHGSFPPWLSSMRSLRILDLSHNRLTGNLPSDFGQQLDSFKSLYGMSNDSVHNLDLWVKGHEYEYRNLEDMTLIDLSSNMLNGEIPMSIGSLSYLRSLNLSHNTFSGKIPESLSNLTRLENLDLSNNELTGIIPETFKNLDSLGVLNLSWNKLEGRIPFEGHMTTFDDKFDFEGNSKLCGKPLETECSEVFHQPLDGQYSLVQNQKFIIWGNENISPFGFVLGFVAGLILATWLIATKM